MKKFFTTFVVASASATALFLSSCAYDPYYSGGSYGYGEGQGYGSSNFSTSFFVGTNSPQWGYDPYARCYYDYNRRSYYDPYLYGYYPVGYRPRYIHGTPHPHGWRRGSNYIAPPSRVRGNQLKDYHHRGERYKDLGRDWSRDIQVNSNGRNGRNDYHRPSNHSDRYRDSGDRNRSNYQRRDHGQGQNYDNSRRTYQQQPSRTQNRNQRTMPSRGGNMSVNTNNQRKTSGDASRNNRGNQPTQRNRATQQTRNKPSPPPQKRKYSRYDDRGIRNNVKR